MFIDFILRNFYNTAQKKFTEKLNFILKSSFPECIDLQEKKTLHLSILNT
ncbi:MAG: DUF2290 domain-containing protein [Leptospiraceae bacterium]|nr:DUF2290 domain-containing protein [Leptospiraceae bacterium]